MKQLSGKDFAKIIEKKVWVLGRIQGSHNIYIKKGREERISIPIHGNKPLKIGLMKHFIKIAQIDEKDIA